MPPRKSKRPEKNEEFPCPDTPRWCQKIPRTENPPNRRERFREIIGEDEDICLAGASGALFLRSGGEIFYEIITIATSRDKSLAFQNPGLMARRVSGSLKSDCGVDAMNDKLTRDQIIEALRALEAECSRRGIAGEICIYGGAEMVLVFDARTATRDVDAVFRPKVEIMEAARAVAEELGIPAGWLNDGVKGFLSHNEELSDDPVPELEGLTNLRVFSPTAEYLLAMKCMAARSDETSEDRGDIEFLMRSLGLTTEEEVFEIVGRFYPLEHIHVKSRYFVSEVIAGMDNGSEIGGEIKV